MNFNRLSPLPLAGLAAFALATGKGTPSFHPMVSRDSRNCFMSAMSDETKSKYQPALAKLESLLMVDQVTVGIDRSSLPSDARGYEESVLRGIGIWQQEMEDCPFIPAHNTSQRPTVLIKFVKSMNNEGGDLQGMIEAEHEFRWNGKRHTSKLVGTMFVVYKTGGRNLSSNEASEVVAHELGHLLGLTDCPTCHGLMGPFVPGEPRLAPSDSELQAVQQFRQQIRDEINRIEDEL